MRHNTTVPMNYTRISVTDSRIINCEAEKSPPATYLYVHGPQINYCACSPIRAIRKWSLDTNLRRMMRWPHTYASIKNFTQSNSSKCDACCFHLSKLSVGLEHDVCRSYIQTPIPYTAAHRTHMHIGSGLLLFRDNKVCSHHHVPSNHLLLCFRTHVCKAAVAYVVGVFR